ncbi:MAG: hypothetical protein Q7R90_01175 [bacterium]|nr:hypothetical protein [bacterium]
MINANNPKDPTEDSNKMADPVRGPASNGGTDAKDPGAISKPGMQPGAEGAPAQPQAEPASPDTSQGEPEVQILEEHVTRVAQKLGAGQAGPAPSTKPTPALSSLASPEPSRSRPSPGGLAALPLSPVVAPAPAPKPVIPPATPKVEAAPLPPASPALGTDIAKILSAVKLPERRDTVLPGEKKVQVEPKKFDTSIAGSALDEGPAVSPVATQPAPKQVESNTPAEIAKLEVSATGRGAIGRTPSDVTAVHTLKDDLQGVVYNQKISLVKAVSLEEDRKAHKGAVASPGAQQRSSRTFGIVFASLTLLILGSGALFGVLFIMNQQKALPQVDTGSSILFAEQSILLSLDGQSPAGLKRVLEAGRATSQGALGSITRIIPVMSEINADGVPQNRPATFREFMAAMGTHASDDLFRALGNDFFLGIHAADKSAPVIVVPVVSHSHAFAAMLSWEPLLNGDLSPLFTAVPALRQDVSGLPVLRTYEDLVMRNYDVRALKDDAGDIQLYYSFPTQNVLIIAGSPYSFPEILSRLQASRQL